MRRITVEESKKIQLQLLSHLHAFCEKNHLRYYLVFGSLLGAIRHKGFIPWDDDIDVAMPREDYRFFMEHFKEQGTCKAISCETDLDYYLPFGKVIDTRTVLKENITESKEIGVYIDVFPMDAIPGDMSEKKRLIRRLLFLRDLLALKTLPNSDKRKGWRKPVHAILRKAFFFTDMNRISQAMNQLAQRGWKGEESGKVGHLANVDASGICREYPGELFRERVLFPFEDSAFYGPKDYNTYLKLVYGNYMQLPPEEARVCKHEYSQFWKD